jgi:hypothetical protein
LPSSRSLLAIVALSPCHRRALGPVERENIVLRGRRKVGVQRHSFRKKPLQLARSKVVDRSPPHS